MVRHIVILLSLLVLSLPALAQDDTFTLQILHSSDNESSFQDPNTLEPKILNYATVVAGLEAVAANEGIPTIHVTAGDHTLPSPFFEAAAEVEGLGAEGLADITFYNAMGLDANGIGNHEFDAGIDTFATMLANAEYPFLAVNLDFTRVELGADTPAIQISEGGQNVADLAGHVAPSAYIELDGERVGLIGRAPADFFNVVEDPDTTLPGLDFIGGRNPEDNQPIISAVDQVLEQVELLESQGINKIILLDHAQDYTGDPLSPELLNGIDIIVSAGSTGFLASDMSDGPFNMLRAGDEPTGAYPATFEDANGNPVLVVNTDQLYTYVGNLIVTFDADGVITDVDPRSGPVAATEAAIVALQELLPDMELTAPELVLATFEQLTSTDLITEQFTVIGTTETELNGARADVRSRETNLGRLTADSTLAWANATFDAPVDIALKNGGGIRDTITGPNITVLTVGTALAFNNTMALVELNANELLAAMENAVSRVPDRDGRFPQIAGMTLAYDASQEGISDQVSLDTPSRIQSLVVTRPDGTEVVVVENGELVADPETTFRMVTNSFLLTGGDGYNAFAAAAEARGSEDPGIGERQILIDYIQNELGGVVEMMDPPADPRVVRLDEGE